MESRRLALYHLDANRFGLQCDVSPNSDCVIIRPETKLKFHHDVEAGPTIASTPLSQQSNRDLVNESYWGSYSGRDTPSVQMIIIIIIPNANRSCLAEHLLLWRLLAVVYSVTYILYYGEFRITMGCAVGTSPALPQGTPNHLGRSPRGFHAIP